MRRRVKYEILLGTCMIMLTACGNAGDAGAGENRTSQEITENGVEVTTETVEKEKNIFEEYVSNTLLEKYGLYKQSQDAQVNIVEVYNDWNATPQWMECKGLMAAQNMDLDNDGQDELFTVRFGEAENETNNETDSLIKQIYLSVYENEDGIIRLADEKVFSPYLNVDGIEYIRVGYLSRNLSNTSCQLSIIDKNGEKLIFNQYKYRHGIFTDEGQEYYWALHYDGNSLNYEISATHECSDFYSSYGLYSFEDGKVKKQKSDSVEGDNAAETAESIITEFLQGEGYDVKIDPIFDYSVELSQSILQTENETVMKFSTSAKEAESDGDAILAADLQDNTPLHTDAFEEQID